MNLDQNRKTYAYMTENFRSRQFGGPGALTKMLVFSGIDKIFSAYFKSANGWYYCDLNF